MKPERKLKDNQQGISLVETLVTVMIMTMLLGAIYVTFLMGQRAWMYYDSSVSNRHGVRMAFYALVRDARDGKNFLIIKDDKGGVHLSFFRPGVGDVRYDWDAEGPQAHQLIRKENDRVRVLAKKINGFFVEQFPKNIYFKLSTVSKSIHGHVKGYSLEQNVALRSKTGVFALSRNQDESLK
jgi:hypothetical protein